MSSFNIRPRFKQHFHSSLDEMLKLFKDRFENEQDSCPCQAIFSGHHIILKIPEHEQHFWSPQLALTLEEEAHGTIVKGLYGPPSSVWTMFAFAYFALAVAFIVTGIAAYSYHMLEIPSKLIYLLPIYALLALILYMIAQFGQKLGAEQTFSLHSFYQETVGRKVKID